MQHMHLFMALHRQVTCYNCRQEQRRPRCNRGRQVLRLLVPLATVLPGAMLWCGSDANVHIVTVYLLL